MVEITYRPIERWPGTLTASRTPSPFKADFTDTKNALRYEVGRLEGKLLVVQLAIGEMDLRVDGHPKVRAEYRHPGVVVSFESKHGSLLYSTDQFDHWHANLRAVALGLEALRKIDRYGISRRGEQYTGWRQLEAGGAAAGDLAQEGPSRRKPMTREEAASFLEEYSDVPFNPYSVHRKFVESVYRRAARTLHPDVGGDPEEFRKLQEARDVLVKADGS